MITGYYVKPNSDWFELAERADKGLPQPIIEELEKYPFELFFNGSRSKIAIPINNTESDWDFAFQYSLEKEQLLLDNGWKHKSGVDIYEDGLTYLVFTKTIGDFKLELVSKNNLLIYKHIWENLSTAFYERFINKRSSDYITKEGVNMFIDEQRRLVQNLIEPSTFNLL